MGVLETMKRTCERIDYRECKLVCSCKCLTSQGGARSGVSHSQMDSILFHHSVTPGIRKGGPDERERGEGGPENRAIFYNPPVGAEFGRQNRRAMGVSPCPHWCMDAYHSFGLNQVRICTGNALICSAPGHTMDLRE